MLISSLFTQTTSESGNKSGKDDFTSGQLKDLFTVNNHTACHTHELLECDCEERRKRSDSEALADAREMDHDDDEPESDLDDEIKKGFVVASSVDTEKHEKKVSQLFDACQVRCAFAYS